MKEQGGSNQFSGNGTSNKPSGTSAAPAATTKKSSTKWVVLVVAILIVGAIAFGVARNHSASKANTASPAAASSK
jgi:hypothetical protein